MLKLVVKQKTYDLDTDTGDVYLDGIKVVFQPLKLKVYAAYAKANKLAAAYNNGQSYAKVFGYVLNINTGKTTSNPDITKVFHRYA